MVDMFQSTLDALGVAIRERLGERYGPLTPDQLLTVDRCVEVLADDHVMVSLIRAIGTASRTVAGEIAQCRSDSERANEVSVSGAAAAPGLGYRR